MTLLPLHYRIEIPEGFDEMSRMYIVRRDAEWKAEILPLQADRLEEVRVMAHNLKGTGTSYGFPGLTDLGGELEHACKNGDPESATILVQHVRSVLQLAKNFLSV